MSNYLSNREHVWIVIAILTSLAIIDTSYAAYGIISGESDGFVFPDAIYTYGFCFMLWYGMFRAVAAMFGRSIVGRITVAFLACILAITAFVLVMKVVEDGSQGLHVMPLVQNAIWASPSFIIWALALLGLTFAVDSRDRSRLLARANQLAQEAQIQALRYQINPHFLHNSLNSIAALIIDRQPPKAEEMVVRLSKFLRSTLSTDPNEDVPLKQEIGVQAIYLEIEKVRFDEQLRIHIEVEDEVALALVPNFILQPLVENAIKHGLGPFPSIMDLWISAKIEG